jgi:tetratricopeptide (TPR) repeat protein
LEAAAERAQTEGDETGAVLARTFAAWLRTSFGAGFSVDELEALARRSVVLLERAADHAGLVHAWFALGTVASLLGRFEKVAHAAEQQIRHARLAGERQTHLFHLASALTQGPRPAEEALRTLEAALPENPQSMPLLYRALLLAMLGRFDEAWALARTAGEQRRELTGSFGGEFALASIAELNGDYEAAAGYLRRVCDRQEAHGLRSLLSGYAPALGRSLCKLGRYDEAESLAQLGRKLGNEQKAATQMLWRQVQALVDAQRGEHRAAEMLVREAVAISERTDALNWQGDALCDLADVLATVGRGDEAAAALEQALDRYQRKQNLAMVAQVRPQLDALRAEVPADA